MNPFDTGDLIALLRRYIFSAVCCVLSLLLIAAIWILHEDLDTLETLNRERTQEGQAMLSTLVTGPLIRQELAHAHETVQRIESNLIIESKLEDNVGYFYRIQSRTKAKVVSLRQQSSSTASDNSDYKVVPFTLHLSGSYEQISSYLIALETGPKLVQVRSFSFKQLESTAGTLALNLEINLLGKR